ncbi:MAG: hypothetical protein ACRDV9_03395 [Acidimicrobiia bacterium]
MTLVDHLPATFGPDEFASPPCNPAFGSPVPPDGYHGRGDLESTTLEGAVSVVGFTGSATMTVAKGVHYGWKTRNYHRYLCGTSDYISQDTRIASLA